MAEYYLGKTIDPDSDEEGLFLKIEGEKYPYKEQGDKCYYDYDHPDGQKVFCRDLSYSSNDLSKNKAIELGKMIIDQDPKTKRLAAKRKVHIDILMKGVEHWNQWRDDKPHIRPILYELNYEIIREKSEKIKAEGLQKVNFSNANLIQANLIGANLAKGNFHEANLGGAKLIRANLREANFCRTDFYTTILSGADLTKANLQGVQIAGAEFKEDGKKTIISNCKVYGSSAWDIKNLDDATQENLEIVYKIEGDKEEYNLKVDDLRMAQFLYFILNNNNLSKVFNATNSSVVLILGRFTNGRKKVLEAIRERLGAKTDKSTNKKYVPILFDFEKSKNYSYTEIVTILAGISRFIIADLTDSKSIPQELQAIVGGFRRPLIPIIKHSNEKNSEEDFYSMFVDYFRYDWVHQVIGYSTDKILFDHFEDLIFTAEELCKTIWSKKEQEKNDILPIGDLNKSRGVPNNNLSGNRKQM